MTYLNNVRAAFEGPIHLVVGVCSDETVESYKRYFLGSFRPNLTLIVFFRRPVMNFDIRVKTIKMSKLADEVIEAPLRASGDFIDANKIDFVTHGSDWSEEQVEDYYGEMRKIGKLRIVPHTPGICTSDIIKEIKSRDDL